MRHLIVLSALFSAGLAALSCQPMESGGFTEADEAAIREAANAWMTNANAGDFGALSMLYTEDAVLMPPNAEAVVGRAEVEAMFAAFPPATFEGEPIEIDGDGDLAYVRGAYSLRMMPEGAEAIDDQGKYLEIWRRQAGGDWQLAVDMFSSDLPIPAPEPEVAP